jgi:hypothetical protein
MGNSLAHAVNANVENVEKGEMLPEALDFISNWIPARVN